MNTGRLPLALLTLCFGTPVAAAQGTPVGWAPSYSGSCESCNLTGKRLTSWNLERSNYTGATFDGAMMQYIRAENAVFARTSMDNANLTGAILTNADFTGATMRGSRLELMSAVGVRLSATILDDTSFSGSAFIGATFTDASMLRTIAEDCDFSAANLTRVKMGSAILRGAVFNGGNFTGASLAGADIGGASFVDTRLIETDLSGVIGYETADFTGACATFGTKLPIGLSLPLCQAPTPFPVTPE